MIADIPSRKQLVSIAYQQVHRLAALCLASVKPHSYCKSKVIKASQDLCSSYATLILISVQRPASLKPFLIPGAEFLFPFVLPQNSYHTHHRTSAHCR